MAKKKLVKFNKQAIDRQIINILDVTMSEHSNSGLTNDRERETEVQKIEHHDDQSIPAVEDLKCFVGGLDYALDSETLKKG